MTSYSTTVNFSYFDGRVTRTFTLDLAGKGSGIASLRLSLDGINPVDTTTPPVDFGSLASGISVDKTFTVLYSGALPATGVAITGIGSPFSITGTTCGLTINANCTVSLRYTAGGAAVTTTQKLFIAYNNSAYSNYTELTVRGTTVANPIPATLTISDGATNTWGRQLVGGSYDKTFTVTYAGNYPATSVTPVVAIGTGFQYKGGSFPGTGGTCTSTISANCTLVLTFSPTAIVNYSGTIQLNFYNGQANTSTTRAITGQGGGAAVLTITPNGNPYNFGTRSLRFVTSQTFTVANAATGVTATALSWTALVAPYNISSTTCTSTLASGASCNLVVTFTPTVAGTFNSAITINYNDGVNPAASVSRNITGVGTTAAFLAAPALNFGTIPTGTTKALTITYTYYGSLPATGVAFRPLAAPFSINPGTCSGTISGNCTATVTYAPTVNGTNNAALILDYVNGAGLNVVLSVNLTGVAVDAPILTFDPTPSPDFGDVAVGAFKDVTFTVRKSTAATVSGVAFTGISGAFTKIGGTCGNTISTTTCTVIVRFKPVVSGLASQTLILSYVATGPIQTTTLSLTGNGFGLPNLTVSSINFGKIKVNQTSNLNVVIANTGSGPTTPTVTALSSPFNIIATTCSGVLNAGASCTLTVQFAPTRPSNYSATTRVSYLANGSTVNVTGNILGDGVIDFLVSANGDHTCVRMDAGGVKCFGHNNTGQLGYGDLNDRGSAVNQMGPNLPLVSLASNRYVTNIAAGFWHNCVILDNSTVKCWGWNQEGQLGIGNNLTKGDEPNEMGSNLPTVNLGAGKLAKDIVAGYSHSCALLTNGTVKCWGSNSRGQLGLGDTASRGTVASEMGDNLPTVNLGFAVKSLSANAGHTCAVLINDQIKCWGDNFFGQLGLGDNVKRGDNPNEMGANLPFVNLGTGRTAKQVACGGGFTCALLDNGTVKCWGRNDTYGQLGMLWCQDADGNAGLCSDPSYPLPLDGYGTKPTHMGDGLPPVDLGVGVNVTAISAGTSHVCAQFNNGKVKCWGDNYYGELGLENNISRGALPSTMGNSLPFLDFGPGVKTNLLSSGNYHNCVVLDNNTLKCWGDNRFGDLGLGTTNNMGDSTSEMGTNLPALVLE